MYTSLSLSLLSLSLSEVSVSDSSPSLSAKQSSFDSVPSCNLYFATNLKIVTGTMVVVMMVVVVVVVVFGDFVAGEVKRLHIGNGC